jgi:spore coat protein CotF
VNKKLVFSIKRKKSEAKQSLIDGREAFNLWDILRSKYVVLDRLMMWEQCAKDVDLKVIIQLLQRSIQENINLLENQMFKYSVKSPDQNKSGVNFPGSSQIITDQVIAGDILVYQQEHIENLLRAFTTSITNDKVREFFRRLTVKTIDHTEKLIQYLKLKGWIETPPLYKHVNPQINESLTTVEATLLWDHLTLRYDNMRTTEIIIAYVHDGDFKATLELGIKTIKKQVNILEEELKYFGIPMPKRPSKITLKPTNTEIFYDDHLYRTLLTGLRTVASLHAKTLKETTFNDRVRGVFKAMIAGELGYIDKYFLYGKIKGWLNSYPQYGLY